MGQKKSRLNAKLLQITVVPLLLTGIVILFSTYITFSTTMEKEVRRGLSSIAITTLHAYDRLYPGDYALVERNGEYSFFKGLYNLTDDDNYLQEIKRDADIDITFFYGDMRALTTLEPMEGQQMVGTTAHPKVVMDVLNGQQPMFYRSVQVGTQKYFAYYSPVYNGDGTCIGMIFAGKPSDVVQAEIWKAMAPTIGVILVMIAVSCYICTSFSKDLVMIISRIKSFLKEISQGNLKAELDGRILQRKDELGEMGRFTARVQLSLREMIEKDMLTKLYSRRIGEMKMRQVHLSAKEEGGQFCVALADIDFFKKFNDTYGHDCGDLVLKEVASVLANGMLGKGFAVRWGGEEFLLVYEHLDLAKAVEHLELLREKVLACEVDYNGEILHVTMTYGIVIGDCEQVIEATVKAADELLYQGKINGRDQIVSQQLET